MKDLRFDKLSCKKMKTKFDTYDSFHGVVLDSDFKQINDQTVIWLISI